MTKIVYTVINRPKTGEYGRTNIGWKEECGRAAVVIGGYLTTFRTPKGAPKSYTATMINPRPDLDGHDGRVETLIGINYQTRATAAFAIWRKYYEGWRIKRDTEKSNNEAVLVAKREERRLRRIARQTPEGMKAYRNDLNAKARARRANMTEAERKENTVKRRAKREHDKFSSTYNGT